MVRTMSVICTLLLHLGFAVISGALFPGLWGDSRADMQELLDLTLHSPASISSTDVQSASAERATGVAQGQQDVRQDTIKEISPVKRDTLLLGEQGAPNEETKRRIYLGTGLLKQGNEIRLNLRAIGAMDFDKKDFYGTYRLSKEDLVLEVKPWNDELILEIPELNFRRPLKSVGKFIWTYGPSFAESEPVEGSITFFPHHHGKTSLPSRVMWMGKEPPMHIGVMQNWER